MSTNQNEHDELDTSMPKHASFWRALWADSRDLVEHAYHFFLLLTVLALFGFVIPKLPLSETKLELIKWIDFIGIVFALTIYTLYFIYRIVKHIISLNPELRTIGDYISTLWRRPVSLATLPPARQNRLNWTNVVNLICDIGLVASVGATAFFAVNDNWSYVFSIPIVVFVKGAIAVIASSPEMAYLNWLYLLCIVVSTTIGAANLHRRNVPQADWWTPAIGLLGVGLGTRISADRMETIVRTRASRPPGTGELA